MVVPARAADNALGLVSIGGARGPLDPAEQVMLAMVARTAFEAAERISATSAITRPAAILSAREIECLVLLVRGHTDQRIAKVLGLSEATARFHLANAREKSGAVSRTHLAALAVAQGWVAL
jgi:DNA-binding CsgD family transcriptional regulator